MKVTAGAVRRAATSNIILFHPAGVKLADHTGSTTNHTKDTKGRNTNRAEPWYELLTINSLAAREFPPERHTQSAQQRQEGRQSSKS